MVHRIAFLCKVVKSYNRQFEVILSRVLNLVMADAVEALDEHRDGGDAGPRDFGDDVMQTPVFFCRGPRVTRGKR